MKLVKELQFAHSAAHKHFQKRRTRKKMNIIYMLYYIYSKKYGFRPLMYLLKGRNFYKERELWKSTCTNQMGY
jgi:hypothetical protein